MHRNIAAIVVVLLGALVAFAQAPAGKSITIEPAAIDANSSGASYGGTQYSGENQTLSDVLTTMYPGEIWLGAADSDAIPKSKFNIKMEGYDVKSQAAFDALVEQIKKQFGVTVTVEQREQDGYTLALPKEAAAKMVKSGPDDNQSYGTSGKGWQFTAANIHDVGKFLSHELKKPVTVDDKAGAGATDRFNFEITASVFHPEELPKALAAVGFELKPTKIKVNVLEGTKAK